MDRYPYDAAPDDEAASDNQRGGGRDSMFLSALLQSAVTPGAVEVRVRNISSGGLMAHVDPTSGDLELNKGETVHITLRGVGEVPARVVWCEANRIGLAFERNIDPRLTRRAPAVAEARFVPPIEGSTRRPGLRRR